jgi:hypothetical protein
LQRLREIIAGKWNFLVYRRRGVPISRNKRAPIARGHIAGNTDGRDNSGPPWLGRFRSELERADLAPATVEGYLKDIRLFLHWQARENALPILSAGKLIAYRQHLIGQCRLRPATSAQSR